jgi:prepilin-type N-terminal cleavage/methylation domain-containing protein
MIHPSLPSPRRGFTLLEVVIALAILAVSLTVLVQSEASAVLMTQDAGRTIVGNHLAQQKMTEALLRLEKEGVSTSDTEEEGDFDDFGKSDGFCQDIDFGDSFDSYKFAYTIRKVNFELGDLSGAADQLQAVGIGPSADQEAASTSSMAGADASALGLQPDMIGEMLGPYIREVRVVVWWGEDPDPDKGCEDCVELTTHVANPSGVEVSGQKADSTDSSTTGTSGTTSGSGGG